MQENLLEVLYHQLGMAIRAQEENEELREQAAYWKARHDELVMDSIRNLENSSANMMALLVGGIAGLRASK